MNHILPFDEFEFVPLENADLTESTENASVLPEEKVSSYEVKLLLDSDKTLGEDLRCEYEYKMGDIHPGEHFAIAGIDDGVAIIGSSVAGEDIHIIYDTEKEAVPCDRTTSYHKAIDPIAAYADGTLYVIGYNTTEPDVMYFRSQVMTPRASQDGRGDAGQPGDGSGDGSGGGLNDPKVIGGLTIGLFAVVVLVLSLMKKTRE